MSRIGKLPIIVPQGVGIDINKNVITVKGKLGELSFNYNDEVIVSHEDNKLIIKPANDTSKTNSMWGLTRSCINNMVKGVSDGFEVKLEINGVGYRASVDKSILTLFLGYSHEIKIRIPKGIQIKCDKPTLIAISGYDKQKVGQVAAFIRKLRKPEPFKGKGIRYENEKIIMKQGKK
jgi:large subunit ribosomal protein L6